MSTSRGEVRGGSGEGEAAEPGSYGEAPGGFRLPPETQPGPVRLRVTDLDRSLAYYREVLGLRELGRGDESAALGSAEGRMLVELVEDRGARPSRGAGRLGLYHFALLLPDRASLGRFVRHLAELGVRAGAGDHLVSEAFYLTDPDGLGIEVYADRPRSSWRRRGRELMMATDPVDVEGVVQAAEESGDVSWNGMPRGTTMGHVHLHVGDLAEAAAFYAEGIGLDRTVWSYPGALFLAAGGYHHHLGVNTWAGPRATPTAGDEAGLLEWCLELPADAALDPLVASLRGGGYPVTEPGQGQLVTSDPWGTRLRVRIAVER